MARGLKGEYGVSLAAKFFMASDNICPPIANQIVFEGRGILDLRRWRKAVEQVGEANPECRLVVRGHMGFCRWVDSGRTPPVRIVEAGDWDGLSSEGAPFTQATLSHREGPMSEVVLIHGEPPRVVFRSHHALMDGRGTISWAEDVFRVLNGEEPLSNITNINEKDLLNFSSAKLETTPATNYITPGGRARGKARDMVWRRTRIRGRYPRLLIQVMLQSAREAWRNGTGPVRFLIPVDLRSRREGLRSYCNLTNPIYFAVRPETTLEELDAEVASRLSERRDGKITLQDRLLVHVPQKIIETAIRIETRRSHSAGTYSLSGAISNLGRMSMDAFNGGGFTADVYWAVPVCIGVFPFSMVLTGAGDMVDLILTMPRVLADGERLETILQNIAGGLRAA
ncbi:MAG: hypothetical protein JW807_16445 [Spirochaetes bacterium]|nr:hypothetical protein [Spirochaetota bacterium]